MDGTTALVELGLGPGATASEITRAFRELAKRAHPDRQGSAAAFHRLRRARSVALDHAAPEPGVPSNVPDPGPVVTPAPGPWLVEPAPTTLRFDRLDSPRRPVRATTPASRLRPLDPADDNGLLFADHLAHALAS